MKRIFAVKQVPRLGWSSEAPLNLRPRLITLRYLTIGLVLFGLGESLLIASGAGRQPMDGARPGDLFQHGLERRLRNSGGERFDPVAVGSPSSKTRHRHHS